MSRIARLEAALEACVESLDMARARVGLSSGSDAHASRFEPESMKGSLCALHDARAVLAASDCPMCDGDRRIEFGDGECIACPECTTTDERLE